MNARRTLAVSRRVLRGLRHDRRSMGLILVAPIMAMFVFGIAFSGEVSDVPVALVNLDTPVTLQNGTQVSLGDSIVAHLDRDLMRLSELEPAEGAAQEAVHMVERGQARAAIIIPRDFSRDALLSISNSSYRGNTTVLLRLDRSNVNVAADIQGAALQALRL